MGRGLYALSMAILFGTSTFFALRLDIFDHTATALLMGVFITELCLFFSIFVQIRRRKALEHFFGKDIKKRTNLLTLL